MGGGGDPSESYMIKTSARKIYGMKPLWCVSSDDVVTLDIVITDNTRGQLVYAIISQKKIPPKSKNTPKTEENILKNR